MSKIDPSSRGWTIYNANLPRQVSKSSSTSWVCILAFCARFVPICLAPQSRSTESATKKAEEHRLDIRKGRKQEFCYLKCLTHCLIPQLSETPTLPPSMTRQSGFAGGALTRVGPRRGPTRATSPGCSTCSRRRTSESTESGVE